jgi:hypothetical protein
MPIFNETAILIRAVEAHIVGEADPRIPIFSYLQRVAWLPVKFLWLGIHEKMKSVTIWTLMTVPLLFLFTWALKESHLASTEVASFVIFAAAGVPLFLVVFAVPSIYCDSGVTAKDVEFVVKHLGYRGVHASDVELLQKSIKPFEDRTRAKVTVLKWLVGLPWAVFTFLLAKLLEFAGASPVQIQIHAIDAAVLFWGILFAYLCVRGYEASVDKLFRAIEFGCNEFSAVPKVDDAG